MDTFLQSVIKDLQDRRIDITKCAYVVPSRRVAYMLNQFIAQQIDQPIFAPEIKSIEDFVTHKAQLKVVDSIDLLFEFYDSYCKVEPVATRDTLDDFISYAPTILNDFNEVDRFLVHPDQLFRYLGNIKDLEQNHWSILEPKTDMVKRYLHFWNRLGLYYKQFKDDCTTKGIVYQGLAYRLAADRIVKTVNDSANYITDTYSPERPIVFVGLNALNKAEEHIIKHYLDTGNALIYWDNDNYFLENKFHEAGFYLRKQIKNWNLNNNKSSTIIHGNFLSSKHINILSASGNLAMSQVVGDIVNQFTQSGINLNRTAIVLADEQLLLPVISAIPNSVKHVNITMGLPLKNTLMARFFEQIFNLKSSLTSDGYYYKDVLTIIESNIAAIVDFKKCQHFKNTIHKCNMVYIQPLADIKSEFITTIIRPVHQAADLISCLQQLIELIKQHLVNEQQYQLELEQLYGINNIIDQLAHYSISKTDLELRSIHNIYKQLIQHHTINFIGEPVHGLQIMGLLETRALDYDHLIMVSVNEGVLPAGKSNKSYIPFDVKKHFNLPTFSDKDCVYAYHFYRLLQRCKTAHLIYNNKVGDIGNVEKSRYLTQLLTDNIPSHHIEVTNYTETVQTPNQQPISINKDQLYFDRLNQIAISGFSPSAITSYIYDPLQFYKSKILRIQDVQEVEENMADNTMGTMIHKTLEHLYKPYINQVLDVHHIKNMQQAVSLTIQQAYIDSYQTDQHPTGKNKIMYEVATHYVNKMLAYDLNLIKENELIIKGLELKCDTHIQIGNIGKVKLHGEIDRIDQLNGQLRIIDYKSGKVERKNLALEAHNFSDIITDKNKSKAFQVLMYAYLYAQNYDYTDCLAGVISFKNFKSGFMPYSYKEKRKFVTLPIHKQELDKFKEQLEAILIELYNPDIPLTQDLP